MRDGISVNAARVPGVRRVAVREVGSDLVAGTHVTQNQFASLVSFAYNEGLGALHGSTLLKKFRAGDVTGAAAEFPRWNKATVHGKTVVLPGRVKRRTAERALFEHPPAHNTPGAFTAIGVRRPPTRRPVSRSATGSVVGEKTASAPPTLRC
jgi:Phage lysozyme